jgi:hypothetical protein
MIRIKNLVYNLAQLLFILSKAKVRILEWGRGTGKSTILGRYIIDCVTQMPRSSGALVASTFSQIKTRTLPSTIAGLESHGIYKDVHFFVGKKPPAKLKWPEPYEPPLDYKNSIIFWNGTVLNFISQDSSGASGRGMNIDWGLADEAALLDENKFQTDFILAMRGGKKNKAIYPDDSWAYFEDCSLHHSFVLATSTPITLKGRWIFKYEQEAALDPDRVAFISASSETNKENLGEEFFQNAKKFLPDFLYRAEILNQRLPQIDNGFYPLLNEEKHCYNDFELTELLNQSKKTCISDADLNVEQPLILGLDWGTSINCMVVAQGDMQELRVLNNLYVKFPNIVDDLIDSFVKYYKSHKNKRVYLYYDPTGNIHTANSRHTVAQQVTERLNRKGWTVVRMTEGRHNVPHELKYNLWNNILKEEEGQSYPRFRMNRTNCKELWISMSNAPAKTGMNDIIQKDKKSERNKSVEQEHATHFSDAVDVIIVGMYDSLLYKTSHSTGMKPRMM